MGYWSKVVTSSDWLADDDDCHDCHSQNDDDDDECSLHLVNSGCIKTISFKTWQAWLKKCNSNPKPNPNPHPNPNPNFDSNHNPNPNL